MIAFWDTPPCRLVGVDRCFRGAYCLHHQGDYEGNTHLWNVGILRDYTALYPRRILSPYSPPWEPEISQCSSQVAGCMTGVRFPAGQDIYLYLCVETCSGAQPASYSVGLGVLYSEVKRPGRETKYLPPPSAKVKNARSYTSTLHTSSCVLINWEPRRSLTPDQYWGHVWFYVRFILEPSELGYI
jgi:hypothetical protein